MMNFFYESESVHLCIEPTCYRPSSSKKKLKKTHTVLLPAVAASRRTYSVQISLLSFGGGWRQCPPLLQPRLITSVAYVHARRCWTAVVRGGAALSRVGLHFHCIVLERTRRTTA